MQHFSDGHVRPHQRRRARPKAAGADDAWTLPDADTLASAVMGAHTLLRDSRSYICGCGCRFKTIGQWQEHAR